jgi:hypothetical protein
MYPSSLGTATGDWQKVSIPINNTGLSGLTHPVMLETTQGLFIILNRSGVNIEFDYIVWKKANYLLPVVSVSLNLYNRTDNSAADKINWEREIVGSTVIAAANQYIELQLSEWFESDVPWGLQIYTDNSIESSSHTYTGEMTTNTVSGLVADGYNGVYVPMLWRGAAELFPLPEPPDDPSKQLASWADAWSPMRDSTANSFYYDRLEDIRLCDKRGFKYARVNEYGQIGYGDLAAGRKIYLFFAGDFSAAQRGYTYKNNTITIELFYE